jgi:RimJ/RimL family protein N-acetyltransferase
MFKPPNSYTPFPGGTTLPFAKHMSNPFSEHALPELASADFALRKLVAADLLSWFDYLSKPTVRELFSWEPRSPEDLQQFILPQDWSHPSAQIKYAIIEKSSGNFIGSIGFHSISLTHQSIEIGYDLHPDYWGKNIMSMACSAMTAWAHDCLQFKRIQATVMENNLASKRVLEKSGFQLEGRMKSYRKVRGEYRDFFLLSHVR